MSISETVACGYLGEGSARGDFLKHLSFLFVLYLIGVPFVISKRNVTEDESCICETNLELCKGHRVNASISRDEGTSKISWKMG